MKTRGLLLLGILLLPMPAAAGAQDARKCGSEVDWETSLDDALRRAAKEGKPVCWYVHTVAGTKMDRKAVVDNYMMMGPFMAPDVIDVLNRRFVPLRAGAERDAAKKYGIRPLDFIEPGLVFLHASGKLLHRMDRLYTYNEEWFVDQLFLVLKENEWEKRLKKEKDPLEQARLYRRLRKPKEAARALKKAGRSDETELERGILEIKQHNYAEAEKILKGLGAPQAQYLYGCVLHLTQRDGQAVEVWKKVEETNSRWAWKAAAELRREGPFSRAFEEIGWMPDDAYGEKMTTTDIARKEKDLDEIVERGVNFLLQHQKSSGVWNDSNYDFGGRDSLPDVYAAGTALSSLALLLWRDVAPERIDAALKRADAYLCDEKNIATTNERERAWAHLYRLLYFAERGTLGKKMGEVAATLAKMQQKDGSWYHEYPNPFVTASVVHALVTAKKGGAEVEDAVLQRGARAVEGCRAEDGSYSYNMRGRSAMEQAAGRMPICEYALFLNRLARPSSVEAAIGKAFEFHSLRERVRKYDDHADRWANGGFFFYYDLLGISFAADALPKSARAKVHKKLREIVLSIGEVDGAWQDSHELGRTYGTSAALILLKRAGKR